MRIAAAAAVIRAHSAFAAAAARERSSASRACLRAGIALPASRPGGSVFLAVTWGGESKCGRDSSAAQHAQPANAMADTELQQVGADYMRAASADC